MKLIREYIDLNRIEIDGFVIYISNMEIVLFNVPQYSLLGEKSNKTAVRNTKTKLVYDERNNWRGVLVVVKTVVIFHE